jgi:hypothetical protein
MKAGIFSSNVCCGLDGRPLAGRRVRGECIAATLNSIPRPTLFDNVAAIGLRPRRAGLRRTLKKMLPILEARDFASANAVPSSALMP